MSVPLSDRMAGGSMPQRNGSGSPNIVPYQVFQCTDGALMIAAGNDKLFAALCATLELHQLIVDPRFATNGARVQHRDQLIPLLKVKIERMSMAECLDKLTAASIPCGPMHNLDQVLQHAQTHALGILQTTPDGQVTTIGLPISFDGQRPPLAGNGPQLGANDDLLHIY
jgi:crotonobetainyl-CoA:carnitine CoA-transferase CaiB-like acyl-CoA transferase